MVHYMVNLSSQTKFHENTFVITTVSVTKFTNAMKSDVCQKLSYLLKIARQLYQDYINSCNKFKINKISTHISNTLS